MPHLEVLLSTSLSWSSSFGLQVRLGILSSLALTVLTFWHMHFVILHVLCLAIQDDHHDLRMLLTFLSKFYVPDLLMKLFKTLPLIKRPAPAFSKMDLAADCERCGNVQVQVKWIICALFHELPNPHQYIHLSYALLHMWMELNNLNCLA